MTTFAVFVAAALAVEAHRASGCLAMQTGRKKTTATNGQIQNNRKSICGAGTNKIAEAHMLCTRRANIVSMARVCRAERSESERTPVFTTGGRLSSVSFLLADACSIMAKVPTRVVPTGPSNQDAPHIGNQFEEDSFFQRVLQRLLPPAAWNPIASDLVRTDL
jgi:hypothetical protein